ncbi:MAG: hypothetical protein ACI4OZ_09190 [Akkermansia sp.]
MQENITYQGLTASTSPYLCQNGEIELCTNIAPSGSQLKPMTPPQPVFQCEEGQTVIHLHKTAARTNYLLTSDNGLTLCYKSGPKSKPQTIHKFGEKILKVCAIGNTLCVLTASALHYILWKATAYTYLGTKPPLLQFQFGLSDNYNEAYDRSTIETNDPSKTYTTAWRQTTYKATDTLTVNSDKQSVTFKPDKLTDLQNHIWALLNQTNALITRQGRFYAPFLVRCAYRLYDGTHIMHSAPVFMPVSMPNAYCVRVANAFHANVKGVHDIAISNEASVAEESAGGTDFKITHLTFAYQPADVALTCRCLNHIQAAELRANWSDIIKAVDIFVTPPVIREDPSEQVKTASIAPATICLQRAAFTHKPYNWTLSSDTSYRQEITCDIPRLSDQAYLDKIHAQSSFYKVHSYNLDTDTIPDAPAEVPIDKSALASLATNQLLTDDYNTHTTKLPFLDDSGRCLTSLHAYNARLNISCIRERLFKGFALRALTPYCENPLVHFGGEPTDDTAVSVTNIYVYLRTDQGTKVVSANGPEGYFTTQLTTKAVICNCPLFYPDTRAYRMRLQTGTATYIDLPMQPHPMLNGAVTPGAVFNNAGTCQVTDIPQKANTGDTLDITNKIYTSQANNPFFFPVTNINTISEGRIVGLSSAAKALSQGQFGQFPLYAFTTEGVWAMQVSDTGAFVTRQPITRDVCINPDSITQVDNAVAFATKRGIMLISGSESRCITEPLKTDTPYNPADELPQVATLIKWACPDRQPPQFKPFSDFLTACGIIYNYNKQQIILYNPSSTYSYVYSITDKAWGIMLSDITSKVNSYPEAMAMNLNGELVTYSNSPTAGQPTSIFILTRPLKFGHPDQLKTVRALIQRGSISHAAFRQVLYASNDLHDWQIVTTSAAPALRGFTGNPYKYYRLAFSLTLLPEESLTGFSVEYYPRLTHKMR